MDNENSFFICFVKTRKKLDKYFKINKIKNKHIIDIRKIIDEENLDISDESSYKFFKILVINKIKNARDKGRDIYYIPDFSNSNINVLKIISLKEHFKRDFTLFNVLWFYDEFINSIYINDIVDILPLFDNAQIIQDY